MRNSKINQNVPRPLGTYQFGNRHEFEGTLADLPATALVNIWNDLAGTPGVEDLKPVRRFTDRKTALNRLWRALERLNEQGAPPSAPASATKNGGDGAADSLPLFRDGSKAAIIISLVSRPDGSTVEELTAATKWQAHSVRGFISATLTKKMHLSIERVSREDGGRAYRLRRAI